MWKGFLNSLPLVFGVAVYGFAFGVLAASAGLAPFDVVSMGLLVFAGAAQIVAVERLVADAGIIAALSASLAINLRYLAITASIVPVIYPAPRPLRWVILHLTTDENWALTLSTRDLGQLQRWRFLFGSGLAILIAWAAASGSGAWLGAGLPDLDKYGLGFAFTAAFIALARAMWRGPPDLGPWLVSVAAATAIHFLFGNATAVIVGGGLAGVAFALFQPEAAAAENRDEQT